MIGEQVQQRERESRNAELAIIRSTAVLCAHYGEVEVDRLIQLLDLNPGDAQRSLKRLIDEHLILESRLGVLGGLHMLRSKALLEASHDEAVYRGFGHAVAIFYSDHARLASKSRAVRSGQCR